MCWSWLLAAVVQQREAKEAFVKGILSMDETDLMTIIERVTNTNRMGWVSTNLRRQAGQAPLTF